MKRNKINFAAAVFSCGVLLWLSPGQAFADDFGRIVEHIEARYHVHRQHRFALGLAGMVVKFWHAGGVHDFKAAVFEDQRFIQTATDAKFDEIVESATHSGYQPLVQSYSRRSGEHTFIYARNSGKNLKLLIVNLEPDEAAVIQVTLDPDRLNQVFSDPHQFSKEF